MNTNSPQGKLTFLFTEIISMQPEPHFFSILILSLMPCPGTCQQQISNAHLFKFFFADAKIWRLMKAALFFVNEWRGHRWSYLQLVRGWDVLMESGMTVACWTEVWVSCCHAGGSKICWVPEGQACCKTRRELKNKGRWVHSLKFALQVVQECKTLNQTGPLEHPQV